MALTACKDCKAEISTDAKNCPKCGAINTSAYTGVRIGGLVYLLLIGLAFYWVWGLLTPDDSRLETDMATTQAEQPQSQSLKPRHFATVAELIEDHADYSAEDGSFKLISSSPLHMQLAPTVVAGDLPENAASEVRRAALYGVYRTFIHTDAEVVKVTSIPREVTINPSSSRLIDRPSIAVTVTRAQALQAVNQLLKAEQLNDLVAPENAGTIQLDNWSPEFEVLYFKEEGQRALLKAIQASGGDLVNNG